MNEQTTKLLEQLANKLGTTSEYLWSILIRQAPINSTITLVQFVVLALYGFILYRLHVKFSREDENERSIYYNVEPIMWLMCIGLIIFIGLCIAAFIEIPDLLNGYFNPEYWALNRILNSIR